MHSSDLPITDYWDPDYDQYDVPLSPVDRDGELEVSWDDWWAAYWHVWMLEWITHGTAWYSPHPYQHQLTTGYEEAERVIEFTRSTIGQSLLPWQERFIRAYFMPEVVRCECWPLVTALGQPPEMERNPDCRLHWAETHLIPCCCEYLLRHVHGAPGPYVPYRRPWIRRTEWLTRCFVIHPDCHWHGDDALPDSPGLVLVEGS